MNLTRFCGFGRVSEAQFRAGIPVCDVHATRPTESMTVQNQPADNWNTFDNMSEEDQGLDVWGFLSRRKSFIILLALVGAGLGFLLHEKQTKIYQSTATLRVIRGSTIDKRVSDLMAEQSLSDSNFVVQSPKILEPAIAKLRQEGVAAINGLNDQAALQRISGMVSANAQSGSILFLSCKGTDPNDTQIIAQTVAEEFIKDQVESYDTAYSDLQQLIENANIKLREDLRAKNKEIMEFEQDSQLQVTGENPFTSQMLVTQEKIYSLIVQRTEIAAELNELEEALRNERPRDALMLLIGKQSEGQIGDTPQNTETVVSNAKSAFQAIMPLLLEEAMLAEKYGPGHPELRAVRRRIEITQNQLDVLSGMTPKQKEAGKPPKRKDFLATYLNSLREQLKVIDRKGEALETLRAEYERNARKLRTAETTRAELYRDRALIEQLVADIGMQISKMELPTNVGGVNASILSGAGYGFLVYPKLSQFLGMGAFLGAFLGLGLGYIVEMADRSFRKPEELIREFGIPILGHVPYMQESKLKKIPKNPVMDRTLITHHLPRSRPAEAYRSVRTAVCFSALGSSHRVIQVTSPTAGDGKSTLAMNFAVSLAQSGKKTIIIESDFRRPRVHKLTGVSNQHGVVDVLRDECELTDAIKPTEIDDFFVMPCGKRPKNPSELLTRPEFEQLLESLREKFDYVIVDTPPVLVVTDPCSVAPRADGVLLCVRLSRHTRDLGRRALEQLRDVGANMTGIVVNGVEETDSYGYGNYSYSDYRYRYNDYSYTDKNNEAYFVEHETEEIKS